MFDSVQPPRLSANDQMRLGTLVRLHFDEIVSTMRRMGVGASEAEDAAQRVFIIASRRLADMIEGSERSFLFGVALRVSSELRRKAARARELPSDEIDVQSGGGPNTDSIVDRHRARMLVDAALADMTDELREAFVLCEMEGMTMNEAAGTLGIPLGTVASRLRRAREQFEAKVKRLRLGQIPIRGIPRKDG